MFYQSLCKAGKITKHLKFRLNLIEIKSVLKPSIGITFSLCSNLITAVKNSCLLARESRFYRAWPPVELYNQSVINEMR